MGMMKLYYLQVVMWVVLIFKHKASDVFAPLNLLSLFNLLVMLHLFLHFLTWL
jgi:hypothetical protein